MCGISDHAYPLATLYTDSRSVIERNDNYNSGIENCINLFVINCIKVRIEGENSGTFIRCPFEKSNIQLLMTLHMQQ